MREPTPRTARVGLDLSVTVEGARGSEVAVARNIGTGGLFLATAQPHQVGERLALTFTLPGTATPISVHGEIWWIRESGDLSRDLPAGIGFGFVDLAASDFHTILKFVLANE